MFGDSCGLSRPLWGSLFDFLPSFYAPGSKSLHLTGVLWELKGAHCQLIENTSSSDWFLHFGTSVKPAKPNPRTVFPHLQTHTGTPSTACTSASIDKKPIFEPLPPLELSFASKFKAFPKFVELVI